MSRVEGYTKFEPHMIGDVVTVRAKAEGIWATAVGRLALYVELPELTGFRFENGDLNLVDEIASIEVCF